MYCKSKQSNSIADPGRIEVTLSSDYLQNYLRTPTIARFFPHPTNNSGCCLCKAEQAASTQFHNGVKKIMKSHIKKTSKYFSKLNKCYPNVASLNNISLDLKK